MEQLMSYRVRFERPDKAEEIRTPRADRLRRIAGLYALRAWWQERIRIRQFRRKLSKRDNLNRRIEKQYGKS